ncbi:alkaline phosphatase superfamily [Fulvivirga imtechensis AK7]|uniref:Alkaline phosphatase superfamily n=2 Tax=Fulvivirga TaxID=396811 RepID=L8JQW5_9BACT|nr:alkaline phosphatase superfamily [Fulvivirga imtechensis AK7]
MVVRKLLFVIIYCLIGLLTENSFAADTTVVKDLSHDWFFYDKSSKSYLPLVSRSLFKENTVHFDIAPAQYSNSLLKITSDKPLSVFINNNIVDIVAIEAYYSLDSLSRAYKDPILHIALYNKNLNIFSISAEVIRMMPSRPIPLVENVIVIKPRGENLFQNFMVGGLIVIAAFLAALYNYFPRTLTDFFKASKALSLRESDENLIKSRPLNQVNLLFYLYLSFLIALVLIFISNAGNIHMETSLFYPRSFLDGMWKWAKLSLILFGWFIAKLLLVSNMSALFRLGNFSVSHFINYMRLTLFIFTIGLLIIIFSYYGFEILSPAYYKGVLNVIFVFMGLRVLILFFKLLSTASYKILHLFSYLCGTEVIPFVMLLYLGLNQPF